MTEFTRANLWRALLLAVAVSDGTNESLTVLIKISPNDNHLKNIMTYSEMRQHSENYNHNYLHINFR